VARVGVLAVVTQTLAAAVVTVVLQGVAVDGVAVGMVGVTVGAFAGIPNQNASALASIRSERLCAT
jgi:hypothetical protein